MTRLVASLVLLATAAALMTIGCAQHQAQPDLPLVTAAMPVLAPKLTVPCLPPPPAPSPIVEVRATPCNRQAPEPRREIIA